MKRITILFVVLQFTLSACEDWLNVSATSELDREDLFKTENGYGEALIGVYAKMCDESLYGRELSFGMLDILGGYYTISSSYNNYYWYNYSYADETDVTAVNWCEAYFENIWNNMYAQIANLNALLETIDANKGVFSGDNYSVIKGEALGLRAYLHFDLLRMFAEAYATGKSKKAIPYVNRLTSLVTPIFTQEKVVELILDDLEAAKALMVNDPMRIGSTPAACLASLPAGKYVSDDKIEVWHNRRFRFNYYAVVATMARVCLWKGDKGKALVHAQEVIAAQEAKFPWVLPANLSTIGDEEKRNQDRTFATEHIFALNVTDLESVMDGYIFNGDVVLATSQNRLEVAIEERSEVYGDNTADLRYQYWFEYSGSKYLLAKFYQSSITARYFQERLPLIRLSEMYYIAAECATAVGDGVDYLEQVRSHRGLSSFPLDKSMSMDDLNTCIREEYKREFWGEGQLWFCYKRHAYTAFSANMKSVDCFTFAIPDIEETNGGRE